MAARALPVAAMVSQHLEEALTARFGLHTTRLGRTLYVAGYPVTVMHSVRAWAQADPGHPMIDHIFRERLAMAEAGGAETIDFSKSDVYDELMSRTDNRGPDSCIDAVGCEAHSHGAIDAVLVVFPDLQGRLVGKRVALVDDRPGFTRDRREADSEDAERVGADAIHPRLVAGGRVLLAGGARLRGHGSAWWVPRLSADDVERQLLGLDAKLVELRLVDDPQDLFDRRDARPRLGPAIVAQAHHSVLGRIAPDGLDNQLLFVVGSE